MGLKRNNPPVDIGDENQQEQQSKPLAEILENSILLDAAEKDNVIELAEEKEEYKGPAFVEPEEQEETPQSEVGHTLHDKDFYKDQGGFQPAIEVNQDKVKSRKKEQRQAKPATEMDLENLDESKIMDMPNIQAASFEIVDMLNLKPKDKTLRFKWANYKNYVAGNLARYYALGFQTANIDDVDQSRTPVDPSMLDGSQVKYYDVLLIKIPVLRLMQLYKANILKSVNRLTKVKERGIGEANRQFRVDIEGTPGLSGNYNKVKTAMGGREPVEFFVE